MYSTSFYLGQNRELSEENDTTSYKHKCVTRNLARDMQITPISFFGSIFIKAQLRRFCSVCTEAPPIDLRMCVFFSISCSCRRENVENLKTWFRNNPCARVQLESDNFGDMVWSCFVVFFSDHCPFIQTQTSTPLSTQRFASYDSEMWICDDVISSKLNVGWLVSANAYRPSRETKEERKKANGRCTVKLCKSTYVICLPYTGFQPLPVCVSVCLSVCLSVCWHFDLFVHVRTSIQMTACMQPVACLMHHSIT